MLDTFQTLRENIRRVVLSRNKPHCNLALRYNVPNEVVTHVEVLGAGMENRIPDGLQGAIRIRIDYKDSRNRRRLFAENSEVVAEVTEPDAFLRCER